MSYIPTEKYAYTTSEAAEILVHSVRASQDCKKIRKEFNLCRSTLLGKLVDPNYCLDKATQLVDCFQTVKRDEPAGRKDKFKLTAECVKQYYEAGTFSLPKSCNDELKQYLSA
mmetsp:Transcript_36161/g.42277  ORF Transcript_36161/g.42277 Transcript_36161/m.42277 type:complete len:113 (+) Transcript_36161:63-401(+)